MNYTNTYSDLKDFITHIFCFEKNFLNYQQKKYLKNLTLEFNDEIRFLIGIQFFQIQITDAINLFRSNRYFTDAVGIKLLPSLSKINSIKERFTNQKPINLFIEELINNWNVNFHTTLDNLNLKINETQFEFLDTHGYLVLENIIPISLCDQLYDIVIELADREAKSYKGGYIYGSGNMQRIYNLIAKNKIFQDLITNTVCHQVMRHMFQRDNFHDKYYLTSFHANLLYENAEPQIWHIDANVPDPIPKWIIRSNSNFIIHDYYKDNGATEIIPGSHKFFKKPNIKQINSNFMQSKFIEAPKGSIAFWHGHLWHRSGRNITKKPRVAVLGAYAASFFREISMEENPFLSLSKPIQDTLNPEIKKLLGWNHGLKDYS